MDLLTAFVIIVIVVVAIVFATGLLKAKNVNSANAILKRLVNPELQTTLPLLAANVPYDNSQQRHLVSSYLFLKNVEDTNQIDMNWLSKLRQDTANDGYLKNLLIPQLMAYSLVLTDLKRNEDVEKLLATHLTEHPDPEEVIQRDFTTSNSLSTLYARISIHMIWYRYSEKHKLQDTLVYDVAMHDKLSKLFSGDAWITKNISAASGDSKIAAGHYYDQTTLEDGYVDGVGIANGGNYIYTLIQALYFIYRLYNYKKIKVAAQLLFKRIKLNYHDSFASLAGTLLSGGRLDLRPTWLKSLEYLYAINGHDDHIGEEYFKQLATLSKQEHIHSFTYDKYPMSLSSSSSIASTKPKILRSVSEGFFRLNLNRLCFEQIMNTGLNNYETTSTVESDFKFNLQNLTGYLNYGCDFGLAFNNYNTANSERIKLAGQYTYGRQNTLVVPNVGALVPLNDYIYYTSHYDNPDTVQAHGFLDLKTGIHEYTIATKIDIKYCAFAWTSKYYMATSKINDYTWCIFDFDTIFTIQTDTTLKLTVEHTPLINRGAYVSVLLDVAKDVTAKIVISRTNDVLKIDNVPSVTFGLPSGITVEPTETNANKLSTFVYGGKTYVISSSVVNDNAMPKTIVSNGVNYPFKNISFGRHVDFVRQ